MKTKKKKTMRHSSGRRKNGQRQSSVPSELIEVEGPLWRRIGQGQILYIVIFAVCHVAVILSSRQSLSDLTTGCKTESLEGACCRTKSVWKSESEAATEGYRWSF